MSEILQVHNLILGHDYKAAKQFIDEHDFGEITPVLYGQIAAAQGDYQSQNDYCNKVISQSEDQLAVVLAYQGLAWSAIRQGDYELAKQHAVESYEKYCNMSNEDKDRYPQAYSGILNTLGSIAVETGKLVKAIKHFNHAYKLIITTGPDSRIATIQNNLAYALQKQGELNRALDLYQNSLTYYNSIGNDASLTRIKSNLAEIYRFRSELDVALKYHQEVLEYRQQFDNKYNLALSNYYVGRVYNELYEYEKAIPYLQESKQLMEDVGNTQWLSATLLALGQSMIELNQDIEEIEQELYKYCKESGNDLVCQRYNLLSAIKNKHADRMSSIAIAQDTLNTIIEGPKLDFELTYEALIQSCEIIFIEMKIASDSSIYDEAQHLINRLEEITRDNGAYGRMIQILFLKAKMAILDLRYSDAEKILTQAEILADECDMPHYHQVISEVRDELQADVFKIQDILEKNQTMMERAKIMELTDYLKQAHHIKSDLITNDKTENTS